jgi:hypothetical protein
MDSIATIFFDISLVDEATLDTCSGIVFSLVASHPETCGQDDAISAISNVLSLVVDSAYLTSGLFEQVRDTLVTLSEERQKLMTLASEPYSVLHKNIRFTVALAYSSDYLSGVFRPRFYAEDPVAEDFIIYRPSNDTFESVSGSDIIGLSLLEFLTDVRGFTDGTNMVVATTDYNLVDDEVRRLQGSEDLNGLSYLARLEHNTPQSFPFTPSETVEAYCLDSTVEYSIDIYCENVNTTYQAMCPGDEGTFEFVCPSVTTMPKCSYWDGSAFAPDAECEVVEYDSTMTQCQCNVTASSSENRRRLSLNQVGTSTDEHTMVVRSVMTDESATFIPLKLAGAPHDYDYTAVTIGVVLLVCCCCIGK